MSAYLVFPMALVVMLSFSNCSQSTEKSDVENSDSLKTARRESDTYVGVLPCTDCKGIETKLTINKTAGYYELSQIFLGKSNNQAFISKGSISVSRGTPHDPTAITIETIPDNGGHSTFWLLLPPSKLVKLTSDKNSHQGDENYTLNKK